MPVGFWNDPDGERYRETYFTMFPGVWRHGDWIEITARGTAIIYGRSDSTINRGGVRMGTAEIYRAVLARRRGRDALVVDMPERERPATAMPLFVVLARRRGARRGRSRRRSPRGSATDCSPRHVPTRSSRSPRCRGRCRGKVLEVPVKRILMGDDPATAASRDSLANPEASTGSSAYARERRAG